MSRFVVLYNFNKYYNRIIRNIGGFENYLALITPGENTPAPFRGFLRENVNFFYENGVYAQHVININKNEPQFAKVEHPDYLVAEESWTEGEGEQATTVVKITRWYILSVERIRGDQFKLSLRRDLLADYYSEVLNAPVFIQRGTPQFGSDPAIFNKEGFTFNQIKKHECLLNNKLDGKGQGWIVGYLAREENPTDIGPCKAYQQVSLNVPTYSSLPEKLRALLTAGEGWLDNGEFELDFPVEWNEQSYTQQGYVINTRKYAGITVYCDSNGFRGTSTTLPPYGWDGFTPANDSNSHFYFRPDWSQRLVTDFIRDNLRGSDQDEALEHLGSDYRTWIDVTHPDGFNLLTTGNTYESYNGTYYIKDGKYHKITIRATPAEYYVRRKLTQAQINDWSDIVTRDIYYLMAAMLGSAGNNREVVVNPEQQLNQDTFRITKIFYMYEYIDEVVDHADFEFTIPATRNKLFDAPYDMFAIPMGEIAVKNASGRSDFTHLTNVALPAARAIATKATSVKCYDIQILPYCPFPDVIDSNGDIDLSGDAYEDVDYSVITSDASGTDVDIGVILYCKFSKGTIRQTLTQAQLGDYYNVVTGQEDILTKKVLSETTFVRFVSPNFSAVYEVNPQKNNGILEIETDYFYKPYSPYIHVSPILNDAYYGADYNDPIGLICSGDFSIATAASKWEEYQIQNVNFENIFNRQIKNLDISNMIAMQEAKITGKLGIATTILGGGAGGAAGGAMAGGGWGAAIGAVVGSAGGGIASYIGYKYDIDFLKRRQTEARSYAEDMYTYQLGNIQALPYSLTRVSAFTANFKVFPFIEIYSCTEEEKQALRDKIKYNGMTIMRIGKISDFINSEISRYVQGHLIRLVGIDEDSEVVAEIANEIKEGAYFYGSDTIES